MSKPPGGRKHWMLHSKFLRGETSSEGHSQCQHFASGQSQAALKWKDATWKDVKLLLADSFDAHLHGKEKVHVTLKDHLNDNQRVNVLFVFPKEEAQVSVIILRSGWKNNN